MNGKDLLTGLNHIDEKFIDEAETQPVNISSGRRWLRWGSVAACACLLIGLFAGTMPKLPDDDEYEHATGSQDSDGFTMDGTPHNTHSDWVKEHTEEIAAVEPEAYAFTAQYIRTDGWDADAEYPYAVVISSRAELEAYYEEHTASTEDFLSACDAYGEAYFEDNNLILIVLEEGSGSIRHKVIDVRRGDSWTVTVQRTVPSVRTDDMAVWHIILSVQMGAVIEADDEIDIRFVTAVEEG